MRYQIYLDGTLVDEPMGTENLSTSIIRDRLANGVLVTQDAILTFIGDGYDYLHDLLTTDSFCSSTEIRIMASEDEGYNYSEYYTGIIFISDVRFNETKQYARAKIQDNSFDAKINNNKNIQALPHVGRSKNDVTITATPYVTVTLFDVVTGTDIPITGGVGNEAQGRAYRVYDLFRFYVDFMTDGEIAFDSTLFGVGGTYEGLLVTSGYMIKGYDGGTTPETEFNELFPKLSYQQIFNELRKKLNLSFIIENGTTAPMLRIEQSSYLNDVDTTTVLISTYDEIETYISRPDIYSSVKFGCGGLIDAVAYNFPETINFVGWNEEQFHTIGTCNVDNTLDLSGEFTCSSNAIQEALDLANLSDMADDAVVLINSTAVVSGTSYAATKTNWTDPSSVRYYNQALTNESICLNYFGYIPNTIALFLGNDDDTFSALKPYDNVYYNDNGNDPELLITCTNVVADPNSNYTSPYYTAPDTGIYSFNGTLNVRINNSSGTATLYNDYSLVFRRTDNVGTFIADTVIPVISTVLPPLTIQQIVVEGNGSVVLNSTDRCYLYIKVDGFLTYYKILTDSYFKCTATSTGGGEYQTYDPSDYSVLRHELNYPLTFTEFLAIKNNPKGVIKIFNPDTSSYRKGFVENIKYDISISKLILLSSRNLNN